MKPGPAILSASLLLSAPSILAYQTTGSAATAESTSPAAAPARDEGASSAPPSASTFEWREIGPSVFGGRIVDVALSPTDASFMLVASASGGLWRTRNNGVTWECIFEHEGTISIGDIAMQAGDPGVIWVGTGEGNNQRSSYWGDGIHKTVDGGETWHNTGLHDSHHIGRIVIDPDDGDRVYVAALGHLYSPNEERGLYRTTDGGQTWECILHINEDVGVVDVVLDPKDSKTIYAASYERRRRAWDFDGAGPGSGIYKSDDGGDTWRRLAGGLPAGDLGRIGLALHDGDVTTVYATISDQNEVEVEQETPVAFRTRFKKGELSVREVQSGGGAEEAGLEKGDVLLRMGEVAFDSVWSGVKALAAYKDLEEPVQLVLKRDDKEKTLEVKVSDLMRTVPLEPKFRKVGGGVYRSTDGGETWEKRNEKAVGGSPPYYYGQIRVASDDVNHLYLLSVPLVESTDGGSTWSKNIAGNVHVDHHALELDPRDPRRLVLGNDGGLHQSYDSGATWYHYENLPIAQFYAVGVDMSVPYNVYGGTQDNGTWGGPSRSRQRAGITAREWYSVGGGDGFYAQPDPRDPDTVYGESQFGALYRKDLATGASKSIRPRKREDEERYRFNWNSPIIISNHNPEIVYFGGNRLFKSFNRGDNWPVHSEDLTTADPEKLEGNVPHCTITTIAESAFDPNRVLVGTDDGLVQLSEDGCLSFTNLTGRFPGAPSNWWVNRVEFSPHDEQVAYVAFTGYREDDFRPFVYRSADGCQTWARITQGLPEEPVNVIREDPEIEGVLYLGTELGAYVSLDHGQSWETLGQGLPTIAVYDLVVHPRDGELVAGTHGRGFWILDVNVVRQLASLDLEAEAYLFEISDAVRLRSRGNFAWSGDGGWAGTNPPDGVQVSYWLRQEYKKKDVHLEVRDAAGRLAAELDTSSDAGLHTVGWNMRRKRPKDAPRWVRPGYVEDGDYKVVLSVGEKTHEVWFKASGDPELGGRTPAPERASGAEDRTPD